MTMRWILICAVVLFVYVSLCSGKENEYNLFGYSGLAYAITIYVGDPPQELQVVVDTGSATLAVASPRQAEADKCFYPKNSTSFHDSGKVVHTRYSQGTWTGHLVSDYVQFPSLPMVPRVRTNIGLITKSQNFFTSGSGWQGLLGLAYMPVGAWGENVIVESWMDSLERVTNKPVAFQLKLCGPRNDSDNTHVGLFKVLDEPHQNFKPAFRTPILRKRWFVVGILAIKVLRESNDSETNYKRWRWNYLDKQKIETVDQDMCKTLTKDRSIIDSGTTNIKIPDVYFRQIVDEIRTVAQASNIFILDEFWYHGEAACWPEPQEWPLPWIGVDLLGSGEDFYYTLEIPPQNYIRLVHANVNRSSNGSVPEYCYKFALEAGGTTTILGYTALEGFDVVFNRTAGWISFQESDCGPNIRYSGPHVVEKSLLTHCDLAKAVFDTEVSIKAAQWSLSIISVIAFIVLVYLLAPCFKVMCSKKNRVPSSPTLSLSQAALFEPQDNT